MFAINIYADGLGDEQMAELRLLISQLREITMASIDEIVTAVEEQTGKVASLSAFITGLEQQIKDALSGATLPAATQAKIDAVFAQVGENSQAISDAIDNDPATPAPAPV